MRISYFFFAFVLTYLYLCLHKEMMKVLKFGERAVRTQEDCRRVAHIVDGEAHSSRLIVVLPQTPFIGEGTFAEAAWMDCHELTRDTVGDLPQVSLVRGNAYTAAIVAAETGAEVLEVWTDGDGFTSADARIVPDASTIPFLTYAEATELCHFGAKTIEPHSIHPVSQKRIPIHIRSIFRPESVGTVIGLPTDARQKPRPVKGISSIDGCALVTVTGLAMVGVVGINERIFSALARRGISTFLVAQASSENSTSIGVQEKDARTAAEVLDEEFASEIETGAIAPTAIERHLATIGIVGEQMKHTPGIAGKLFSTLGRNGINVIAISQGARQNNISIVVHSALLAKALHVLHEALFLGEHKMLHVFICGVGTVGGMLIEQIRQQADRLLEENRLRLNVVGIISSAHAIYSRQGLPLDRYREMLKDSPPSDTKRMVQTIAEMNPYNAVFVDCTASQEVAECYATLLQHNVSVVTANKIAASGPYDLYLQLKQTAVAQGVKFLFETNVGAGLPIISTINDLRNSGDHIIEIQAVLSGTLNFVFNEISATTTLSQAVRKAQQQGYSEPDPRIDLCGKDVIRKLVILTREAGYPLEQEDVERKLFLPDECFEGTLDEFWQRLQRQDAAFEQRRRQMETEGRRWRFVAKMVEGRATVALEAVASDHPFYHLEGSNNIILLTTERYRQHPMLIQGYGAGAAVTAAGVFANLMSIVNI